MTDDVTAKLAEWEALVAGATRGPWEASSSEATMNDRSEWRIGDRSRPQVLRSKMRAADAEFIAASPTIARALLGFVREVLATAGESNTSPDYRADAYDQGWEEGRDGMAQRTEQAARKWIGGAVKEVRRP